jgi:hypothetical protein
VQRCVVDGVAVVVIMFTHVCIAPVKQFVKRGQIITKPGSRVKLVNPWVTVPNFGTPNNTEIHGVLPVRW